jgi:hypothetical protein
MSIDLEIQDKFLENDGKEVWLLGIEHLFAKESNETNSSARCRSKFAISDTLSIKRIEKEKLVCNGWRY